MLKTLRSIYEKISQEHVFAFYDKLSDGEKHDFMENLLSITAPDRMIKVFWRIMHRLHNNGVIEPLDPAWVGSTNNQHAVARWNCIGREAISGGEVAVVLLAGGQGTRLGSLAPKGCFDIGLPSKKSLFELQADRIAELQKETSSVIPWYIMTSGATRKATEKFFGDNGNFGLDHVTFFEQDMIPAFTHDGKFILSDRTKFAMVPNGNGGMYKALHQQGILDDMERRGVKYVHVYCVDNCLVKVADPVFIGFGIERNADCAVKCVPRIGPEESVGIFCKHDGKPAAVEYSEIDKRMAKSRDVDGNLTFNAANIVNHFFTVYFLRRMVDNPLDYHVARKKVPYLDTSTGNVVEPSSPNGIKLELFIFDVVPWSERFSVLMVDRETEFAPVKNKQGADSPETARAALERVLFAKK